MKTIIMNCTVSFFERINRYIYEEDVERQEENYFALKN